MHNQKMMRQLKWNVTEKNFKSQNIFFFIKPSCLRARCVCVCAYVVINEIKHPIILDWFE